MENYVIITDSSCDLTSSLVGDIIVVPLFLTIDGTVYANNSENSELTPKFFYTKLREGAKTTTSAANIKQFLEVIEPLLSQGKDVLYLGFSSALSGTFGSGNAAINMLKDKYPERKLFAVDTLSASLGQGLLVYLTEQKRKQGASIEEARDFAESTKLNICHWFTVDDLGFLKRGARISSTVAFVGTLLNIKPVLHVDDLGRLMNVEKTRGRLSSIELMLGHMKKSAIDPASQTVFISHGDCLGDAELLKEMIIEQLGVKEVHIGDVGPVIGAHSGPGTLALFFVGTQR